MPPVHSDFCTFSRFKWKYKYYNSLNFTVRWLRNYVHWFSTACDALEQIIKHSSRCPFSTTYLVLLWLFTFLHPWTAWQVGEAAFLSGTPKKKLLKSHSCCFSLTLGHSSSPDMVFMNTKVKREKQDRNNAYQICGNVHAGAESRNPLKNTGTASDRSVCRINTPRLRSCHGALGCTRFCTAAIDERSLGPNLHLIPPSVSAVSYHKSVPVGFTRAREALLSQQFHTFLRWNLKSAA